jgi:hypothetical protein
MKKVFIYCEVPDVTTVGATDSVESIRRWLLGRTVSNLKDWKFILFQKFFF